MIFDVLPLRDKGWALPRHRLSMLRAVRGDLEVVDQMDGHLRRACRIAQLLDPNTGQSLPAPRPLHDVQTVRVAHDYLVLTGIERVDDALMQRSVEYAQSWLVTFSQDTPNK